MIMNYSGYRQKFRLYRRRHGRLLFGVCGGIADSFELPVWAVRVTFIILALVNSLFIALYVLLAFLMKPAPTAPYRDFAEEEFFNSYETSRPETLAKMERSFRSLDKRLQNLETVVTSPGFKYEKEFRDL